MYTHYKIVSIVYTNFSKRISCMSITPFTPHFPTITHYYIIVKYVNLKVSKKDYYLTLFLVDSEQPDYNSM